MNDLLNMVKACVFAPFARNWLLSFRRQLIASALVAVGLLLPGGCSQKAGIEASISRLEKAFRATTAPGQTAQPMPGQPPGTDAKACVLVALAAVRSNDYATAVVVLNGAVRAPGVTPDQFLAVQQAKTALITDLQNRAERGDAGATVALKSIQASRSH